MRKTIDLDRIHEATGGDPEFTAELVTIFLEDAVTRVSELKIAIGDGDTAAIVRSAHQLKGASANMGATALSAVAATAEQKGRDGDLSNFPQLLSTIESELRRAEKAFLKIS